MDLLSFGLVETFFLALDVFLVAGLAFLVVFDFVGFFAAVFLVFVAVFFVVFFFVVSDDFEDFFSSVFEEVVFFLLAVVFFFRGDIGITSRAGGAGVAVATPY